MVAPYSAEIRAIVKHYVNDLQLGYKRIYKIMRGHYEVTLDGIKTLTRKIRLRNGEIRPRTRIDYKIKINARKKQSLRPWATACC